MIDAFSSRLTQSLHYQVYQFAEPRPDLMDDTHLRAAITAIERGTVVPDGWAEKFQAELQRRGLATKERSSG